MVRSEIWDISHSYSGHYSKQKLILRQVQQRSGPSEQAATASSQSKDNVHIQHDLEFHQDTFVATYQECLLHDTDSLL